MPTVSDQPMQGHLDWQGRRPGEFFDRLPAFGMSGMSYALPRVARLARRADGSPWFYLEFFSAKNDPDLANSVYAMVEMGIEQAGELADEPGEPAVALAFTSGNQVHMACGGSCISLPFVWEAGRRATLKGRLPMDAARLVYGALVNASPTILRAAIECEVPAVLPRVAATVQFKAAELLREVQTALAGADGNVPFEKLVKFLDAPLAGLLTTDTPLPRTEPGTPGVGLALAGRLRQIYGRAAPCAYIEAGAFIALSHRADDDDATVVWDLRTPVLAAMPTILKYDPFSFVAAGGGFKSLTAFTSVPLLPDALRARQVTVASPLPSRIENCDGISVTVRVDKSLSASGRTDAQSAVLYPPPAQAQALTLRYAKAGTPRTYSYALQVVGEEGLIDGPWTTADTDYLHIDAGDLPVAWVALRATQALMQQCTVRFECTGPQSAAIASGRLDAARPATALLVDRGAQPGARLAFTIADLIDPSRTLALDLPCASIELDVASFPGYGPQSVDVDVRFHEGTTEARLEFRAEAGDAAPVVLVFSPDLPSATFSYFSDRVLAHRYRFRAHAPEDDEEAEGAEGAEAGPWSPYLQPGLPLHIGMHPQGPRQQPAPAAATKELP